MQLASLTTRPVAQRLLIVLAVLAIALAWLKPLDQRAQSQLELGLKRALATFAIARTINGAISVVQETAVSVQPGGVGMTFAPGQFLDPLNDMVEQVSSILLAVCVSFGIQLILIHIGGSALVSAALTLGVAAYVYRLWTQRPIARWASRLLVAMILVRFAMPLSAIATELTYELTMAAEYREAQGQLEATSSKVGQGSPPSGTEGKAGAVDTPGFWDFLKSIPKWGDAKPQEPQERGKIEQIKAWLDGAVEHMLRLVAIFVVHTVLLPLAFMALLGKLLAAMLLPRRP
jgi:hypothetical protein